jgi:exodeoxyribonuclease VII small subunit
MPKAEPSYQELQAQLDEILARLQSDDVDVDTALKLYQEGQKLVKSLESRLTNAENTIRKLQSDA